MFTAKQYIDVKNKYMSDVPMPSNKVVAVKSALGTGKTRMMKDLADAAGSFLAVCHRVSLAKELATQLGLSVYSDKEPTAKVAYCVNSIGKAASEYDTVFIDEFNQVIRAIAHDETTGQTATRSSIREDCWHSLRGIVRNAKRVFIADAHLDQRLLWCFLKHCGLVDDVVILSNHYIPRRGKALIHHNKNALIKECALFPSPRYVSCTNKDTAEYVNALLIEHGLTTLLISADNKGEAEQAAGLPTQTTNR